MSDLSDLAGRVRVALGVNASFDGTTISEGILRAINRLLRDYNFPKSLRKSTLDIAAGQDSFAVPEGFKKEKLLRWINPADGSISQPLSKREGLIAPNGRGYPRYYWLQGLELQLDTAFALEYAVCKLELFWQSMASKDNLWMLVDFEDVVYTYSVYRLSVDFRKPEVLQAYTPLWAEDRQSIAVYANELEFDQLEMVQHETRERRGSRYPASTSLC